MRDNAGENKSTEVTEFFESRGVETRYSAAYEQWQNGPAEASVRVTGRLIRSELSSTGLPTSTWFSTLIKVIESTNAAWTITTNSSPHFDLYGEKKDVSKMRRLGCQAFVYPDSPWDHPRDCQDGLPLRKLTLLVVVAPRPASSPPGRPRSPTAVRGQYQPRAAQRGPAQRLGALQPTLLVS